MRMHWQRDTNSVRKRLCRKVVAFLLIVGIPALLFLFTFSLKKVDVIGVNRYTDKQIKELLLTKKTDYNSLLLYLKYRFFTKPEIPFVEKIDLELVDNHTVAIYVYEKKVAGCVEFMGEYLYFDKDGIVVESSPDKIEKVPVVEGLQFNEIILHKKLKVQNNGLYDVIMNITSLIQKYNLDVDTISFDKNYEITLVCKDVNVLIGKQDHYDTLIADLKTILTKAKGTGLYELDMRDYSKANRYYIGKSKKSTE